MPLRYILQGRIKKLEKDLKIKRAFRNKLSTKVHNLEKKMRTFKSKGAGFINTVNDWEKITIQRSKVMADEYKLKVTIRDAKESLKNL
tara:strand:- start:4375 stop:4638 length:264 start_codon:yes stop_codon:yes gene_type:complete